MAVQGTDGGNLGYLLCKLRYFERTSSSSGKYSLPEYTARLTETINASVENGTYFVEQVIEMTLHKLIAAERAEIKLLAAGRPQIIVEDNNGNFLLLGYEKGCNMSAGSAQSGTAAGDLSGYQLTFTANEDNTAPFVAGLGSATINNP